MKCRNDGEVARFLDHFQKARGAACYIITHPRKHAKGLSEEGQLNHWHRLFFVSCLYRVPLET